MLVNLFVKVFAKRNHVSAGLGCAGKPWAASAIPELHVIEEMKTRPIDHCVGIRRFCSSEEDRGAENALERFGQTPIVKSVFGQAEEVEHLGGGIKMNLPGFLPDGECGHPDRDQAVLAERKTELGMPDDLKKEMAIAPGMRTLVLRRATQRDTTENKRPRMEGNFLFAIVTLLADELN